MVPPRNSLHHQAQAVVRIPGASIDITLESHNGQEFFVVNLRNSYSAIRGVKPGTKTDEGTTVPVAKSILAVILPHLPERGPLFPSFGKHGLLTHRAAIRHFSRAMVKVGIRRHEQTERLLGFHSWKHTFVTRAASAGLSPSVRSAFTEHKDEKTADGYKHLRPSDLIEVFPIQLEIVAPNSQEKDVQPQGEKS